MEGDPNPWITRVDLFPKVEWVGDGPGAEALAALLVQNPEVPALQDPGMMLLVILLAASVLLWTRSRPVGER